MTDVKLGNLIGPDARRDAVHIAIAPVIAAEKLQPGQHVGFVKQGDSEHVGDCEEPIGIVDPFLKRMVQRDERFYLCLYPNTTTSLRHEWSHTAFMPEPEREAFDMMKPRWRVEQFAKRMRMTFDEIMQAARDWAYEGMPATAGSTMYSDISCDEWEQFWTDFGTLTGTTQGNRGNMFDRCAC